MSNRYDKKDFDDKTYTLDMHVKRLEAMLKEEDACKCCPAAPNFAGIMSPFDLWTLEPQPCHICASFIGLDPDAYSRGGVEKCPCKRLTPEEAIERTINAIARYRANE